MDPFTAIGLGITLAFVIRSAIVGPPYFSSTIPSADSPDTEPEGRDDTNYEPATTTPMFVTPKTEYTIPPIDFSRFKIDSQDLKFIPATKRETSYPTLLFSQEDTEPPTVDFTKYVKPWRDPDFHFLPVTPPVTPHAPAPGHTRSGKDTVVRSTRLLSTVEQDEAAEDIRRARRKP